MQLLALSEEMEWGVDVRPCVRPERECVHCVSIGGDVADAVHREGRVSGVDSSLGCKGVREVEQ